MENTSPPLATESFSYSWLASTPKSSSESLHKAISNNNDQYYFQDETNQQHFDFDISVSKSYHPSLVHADELFSNGLILPRSVEEPSNNSNNASCSSSIIVSSSSPVLLINSKIRHSSSSFRRNFLGKWSKLIPGKFVSKYIKRLIPMKRSIGRSGTRVDDVNRLTWEVKSSSTPQVASPRKESAAYSSYWNDIDESSISEAILYCKRSSGLC